MCDVPKVQVIGDELWFDGYHVAILCPFAPYTVLQDFAEHIETYDIADVVAETLATIVAEETPVSPWKGYKR